MTRRPAARSATRDRRSASARRCRRAQPAGGSIRRCRTRARAAPSRPRPPRRNLRSNRPGCGPRAQGLRVGPKAEFSVDEPIANSSQLVLPMKTAPAASRRETAVASKGGTNDSRIRDEAVVRTPRVQRLSLRATGMPARGWSRHFERSRSMRAARFSACSPVTVLNACSAPSCASMRASASSQTSTAVRSPRRMASRSSRSVAAGTLIR